jgi:hypothetical protein
MITREELKKLIVEALISLEGSGRIIDVCKYIWDNYEDELRKSGDIFYTWQYDVRWAGQALREEGQIHNDSRRGPWILSKKKVS